MKQIALMVCLLWATVSPTTHAQSGTEKSNPAGAQEIVQRMADSYKSLSAYRDEGTVVVALPGGSSEVKFKTEYDRKSGLQFEYISHHPYPPLKHLITTTRIYPEGGVYKLWTQYPTQEPTIESRESLSLAVATITGTSKGSAAGVVPMIDPDALKGWGASAIRAKNLTLIAEEMLGDVNCYVVTGNMPGDGSQVTLWIGKADFLLRRTKGSIGKFEQEENRKVLAAERKPV
jgi:hypothetical protein